MVSGSISSTFYGRPRSTQDIDIIIRKDRPYSIEEFKRRRTVDVLGLSIHLAAPEDAILSKLEWAKKGQAERQFTDALGVAIVQSDKLDFEYMQTWARILDIEEHLNRSSSHNG